MFPTNEWGTNSLVVLTEPTKLALQCAWPQVTDWPTCILQYLCMHGVVQMLDVFEYWSMCSSGLDYQLQWPIKCWNYTMTKKMHTALISKNALFHTSFVILVSLSLSNLACKPTVATGTRKFWLVKYCLPKPQTHKRKEKKDWTSHSWFDTKILMEIQARAR